MFVKESNCGDEYTNLNGTSYLYFSSTIRVTKKVGTFYAVLAIISIALLIFGILGMTKSGVFGNMGDVTAKILTGVGGGLFGLELLILLSIGIRIYQDAHRNPLAGHGNLVSKLHQKMN